MTDWSKGSPDPPNQVPANAQGLWRMPAVSVKPSKQKRERRGKPGCDNCGAAESGVCERHSYDPLRSLKIVRPTPEQAFLRHMEKTWWAVL